MSERSLRRHAAIWLAAFCTFYAAFAYLAAPEFWTWRERLPQKVQVVIDALVDHFSAPPWDA